MASFAQRGGRRRRAGRGARSGGGRTAPPLASMDGSSSCA